MQHITQASVVEAGTSRFFNSVDTDGHQLVMDEPESMGGTDLGPSPFALVAAALGACTNMTLRMYADMKNMALDQVETEVVHTPGQDGHHFKRTIKIQGNLSPEERERLLVIANKCPVHKLLEQQAVVDSELAKEAF
jgi:putative redox protein